MYIECCIQSFEKFRETNIVKVYYSRLLVGVGNLEKNFLQALWTFQRAERCLKRLIWMYRANPWTSNIHVYVIKFTWGCDLSLATRSERRSEKLSALKLLPSTCQLSLINPRRSGWTTFFSHFETMYKLKLNVFREHFSTICTYIILSPLFLLSKFYEFFTKYTSRPSLFLIKDNNILFRTCLIISLFIYSQNLNL